MNNPNARRVVLNFMEEENMLDVWRIMNVIVKKNTRSRQCIYELGIFQANRTTKCLKNQGRTKGEGWSTAN